MFTTAMISRVEGREIVLFFTGRNHAGENIVDLLKKRTPGLSPPKLMFDGSSMNPPKEFEALLGNCLTHARRGFVDLADQFPLEIKYVINVFAEIFHFDAIAKEKGLNDDERLKFHQENSGPFIDDLKAWCRDQLESKKVEPNGPLGKAIKYMEKRWDKLTLFLRVPGAPLSTNTVERTIKTCVLHRKASLVEKARFSVQHASFDCSLDRIGRKRGAWDSEKECEFIPPFFHILDGFSERAVGFNFLAFKLVTAPRL